MGTKSCGTLIILLGLLAACKHRVEPPAPEEMQGIGSDVRLVKDLLIQPKTIRALELIEDGFMITDNAAWNLDLASASLTVERRYDPVPSAADEPLVMLSRVKLNAAQQKTFLETLAPAAVRQVPQCTPYTAVDGGYGGRFLTIVDANGREHTLGASDAACGSTDHECSGACISQASMEDAFHFLTQTLPFPDKPRTSFACHPQSPLGCSQATVVVFGEWQKAALRADVRRFLAEHLCGLAAFSFEDLTDGSLQVLNSARTKIGTIRFDTTKLEVSCLTKS